MREWKKVIKEATKSFEFETKTTSRKRGEEKSEMVADVGWLEKRLGLRSAEQK